MPQLLAKAHQSTNAMFHEIFANPVFSVTTCIFRNRFRFLISYMSFNNHTRWQHNRFAAFRESFEKCNKNCGKFLVPDDCLSLDETLYPTRAQITFKQFNPRKPAKY